MPLKKIPAAVGVFLLPLLLGAPFAGRTYFVDDHYHVLMARGLLDHPARPYDFVADDAGPGHRGWERGQPPRMVNPPLHHYALALFWKLTGGRLWAVRLLSLFFSAGAALMIFFLARRFVVPPVPAAVLSALSPAFWLSSHALLIDSTLMFFFCAALWAWTEGLARRSAGWLAASGVAMGAAILTKYTGGYVGVLALLYWAVAGPRPRWKPAPLFLAIPAAVLGLWSLWNLWAYGAPHLTESSKRVMQSFAWSHVLVFLSFLTGSLGFPFFAVPRTRRGVAVAGSAWGALTVLGVLAGFTLFQGAFIASLVVLGTVFLGDVLTVAVRSPFSGDRFLALWLLLGAVQMIWVMQWVAARYYLTLLPPAVFLFLRALRTRRAHAPEAFGRVVARTAGVLFLLGGGLAVADWAQAETGRRIVDDLRRDAPVAPSGRKFILWDSFRAGDLLKEDGWQPAFPETVFVPGDLLLRPEVVMPPWWFGPGRPPLAVRAIHNYPCRFPVRVMDNRGAAGFYASAWGPLPFTLSRSPLERYTLFEVLSKENN
jgi:4-amino-4-deoxy-L-arabinose transferase-like glycosyltransferase